MKPIFIVLILAAAAAFFLWVRLKAPFKEGNGRRYDLDQVEPLAESPLRGKTIYCLGSSVTLGMASFHLSFVDYIAKRNGCTMVKDAVSSSTLADRGRRSYVARLKRHATSKKMDCLLCQLSTNDATFRSNIGKIIDSYEIEDFDPKTTIGGIETVIAYARKTWNCPVVFYTVTKFDNPNYHRLVNLLLELQEKWGIGVIDLWHSAKMNSVDPWDYKLYMNDGIHPTKAGYLLWWTPVIEEQLYQIVNENKTIT